MFYFVSSYRALSNQPSIKISVDRFSSSSSSENNFLIYPKAQSFLLEVNVVHLRSLIRPSNVSILQRVGIVTLIVYRASIIVERPELPISLHHDAAAEKDQDLENDPEDEDRDDE